VASRSGDRCRKNCETTGKARCWPVVAAQARMVSNRRCHALQVDDWITSRSAWYAVLGASPRALELSRKSETAYLAHRTAPQMLGTACGARSLRDRQRGTASAGEYVDDFCGPDVARHGLNKQTLAAFAERPRAGAHWRRSIPAISVR